MSTANVIAASAGAHNFSWAALGHTCDCAEVQAQCEVREDCSYAAAAWVQAAHAQFHDAGWLVSAQGAHVWHAEQ
eukprot:441262-Amphidinium_carterae.1